MGDRRASPAPGGARGTSGRWRRVVSSHLDFLLLLAVLAGSLAGATVLSYRTAVETADALLWGQAMDVALAAEAAARRSGGDRAALQAALDERQGGGVAYAAVAASDGTILATPTRASSGAGSRMRA